MAASAARSFQGEAAVFVHERTETEEKEQERSDHTSLWFSEFNQEPPDCEHISTEPSCPSFLVVQHFQIHIQTYFKRLSFSCKPFVYFILLSGFIVSLISVPFGMWRRNKHLCFYPLSVFLHLNFHARKNFKDDYLPYWYDGKIQPFCSLN